MIPHQITLDEAIALTSRFRKSPGVDMPFSETFEAASILRLLNQPGCQSFRIYLGRKTDNRICSVLVAVDANGKDILPPPPTNPLSVTADVGIIIEDAFQCPPVCPPITPLNG